MGCGEKEFPNGLLPKLSHLQVFVLEWIPRTNNRKAEYVPITVKGKEVACLRKLERLECYFEGYSDYVEYLKSRDETKSLSTYKIFAGPLDNYDYDYYYDYDVSRRKTIVWGNLSIDRDGGFQVMFPKDIQRLDIDGYDDATSLCDFLSLIKNATELEAINIVSCNSMESLVSFSWFRSAPLPSPSYNGIFSGLKKFFCFGCSSMKKLFPLVLLPNLVKLEEIIVEGCEKMEEIIGGTRPDEEGVMDCELVEFNLQGHRFTWFRGGSMSRIDKAFASPDFHLQFPSLSLCRYPRGLSDHCQLLLQSPEVDWGWKPFHFINCWLSHPSFLTDFEALWSESCKEFPASLRKGRNYISKIEHNGSHLVSSNDIKEGAVNFFSSLFCKPTCKRIEMGGSGFSKISEAKSIWLERPPSMEEVKQAVWDCDGSKAPDPDGFTFCFYKKVWNIISSKVFMLVKSFFRTGKLPKGINSSFVTLIPKLKEPSIFSHFRPISLIHGLYKIVAKLLSTRLRHVMTDVISVNQSAFIAGRQILDGFMIANEVVHGVRSKKKHGLLLKVDFHKAFDSILWEHIDTSMGYMGFGSHWRKLIFECLSTSKLAILINGSPSREFSLERGLRQGDPLSPFLFDIAVQGLTVLFNRASASGYFKGLQTTPRHYLTHLQYADDSLIFLPNDFPSLLHAKRILCWFEIISGLKVNFYKSSLIGINLDNDYTSSLANSVFCRSDTFPIRYLGLPLGANPNRLSTWKPVLSTIRAKLLTWKGNFLSMAGRLCLIKSVLSSLPLFYMSVFAMPKGVTKAISSLTRSFLWKGSSTSHGLFKVAWHKVIKDKSSGGLGLGSIHNKNLALLFKWLWNLDNGVAGGWQEHILLKYRPHFINGIPEFAGSLSPTWHGIVSAIFSTQNIANLLHANVGFKVGDRRNIRFWTDSWLGSATNLQLLFPRLYNLSLQQNTSLADIYNLTYASLNLSWRRTLRPREICQRESLIAEVQRGLLFSDGADCKLWKFHSSGMYSAQSGRLFFDSLSATENNHSLTLLWNGYAPLKVDVFIWLLLHGGLSTRSFLAERRIINYEESHCPFCCKETETINHLFHWCHITWSLWGRFFKWFGCSGCLHKDPNQNLKEWSGLINGKFQRRAITLLCKGLYWSIWIARNRLIFESKAPDWDMIFDLTFHRLAFWLKSSVTNFSYTGSNLFRNPECIMNWTN
ncbi:uncharacterized protein [Populus alba]|uniref:uncharacterized protein n=1 Tax=Populus alba TaxID=43335 RepID=UPI003CC77318